MHTEFMLYFSSSSVEQWTTYRLQGAFDFVAVIGGTMGLFLGCSFLSLIFDGGSALRFAVGKFAWAVGGRVGNSKAHKKADVNTVIREKRDRMADPLAFVHGNKHFGRSLFDQVDLD